MKQKNLQEIFKDHTGKLSDKWSSYLDVYDRLFSAYREKPIRLLEIGIQNGGSLEVWAEYFVQAQKLIGCDINPSCDQLRYDDPRISVVVGDANSDSTEDRIVEHEPNFDLIIDDGSHRSSDIIKSFVRYFPKVVDGGMFVAEDLHCSYWQEFEGGLFDPYSSLNFFKRLVDVISSEHWGVNKNLDELLAGFSNKYNVCFDREIFSHIHSIEFINSICVIRKSVPLSNMLGARAIVGQYALVENEPLILSEDSRSVAAPDQSSNFWSMRQLPPDEELVNLIEELDALKLATARREEQVARLKLKISECDDRLVGLNSEAVVREEQIASLKLEADERDKQIASLKLETAERDKQIIGLKLAVAKSDEQIVRFLASKSWRLTRPFRFFCRLIRKIWTC